MPFTDEYPLHCHPGTDECPAVALSARLDRDANGALLLVFQLRGGLDEIALPASRPPAAADHLWQHTCCEVFIASTGPTGAYREFNFSPSGEWAAYDFSEYRLRNARFQAATQPHITCRERPDGFDLLVSLPAALLPPAADNSRLLVGLATVLETPRGTLSYWALRHPAEEPDFHHRDGRVLDIADPRSSQEKS